VAKGRHAGTKRYEFVVTKEFYQSLKEIAFTVGIPMKELLGQFFQDEFEERRPAWEARQAEIKRLGILKFWETYCKKGPDGTTAMEKPRGWDNESPRPYGWSGWGGKKLKRIYLHLPPDVYKAMHVGDLKKLLFRIKEWRRSRACDTRTFIGGKSQETK
jgi:hypothetical protein